MIISLKDELSNLPSDSGTGSRLYPMGAFRNKKIRVGLTREAVAKK